MPAIADEFTSEELQRYSRHLMLPEVGFAGQRKLKAARVLLIGAGGLGSPAGLYLAAAGVGTLGIVDFDVVERSNLQRQVIHSDEAVGSPKTASAARRISGLNRGVHVAEHAVRLSADNALELVRGYDVIVDGTDNFAARYLVNDACVMSGKPNVYGSILRFEGQASLFDARSGPCYRCIFPQPPPPGDVPSCAEAGVLGVVPGIIGLIQATETIKRIVGAGTSLLGRLLLFDALAMRFRELKLRKDPLCPTCGPDAQLSTLVEYEGYCAPAPSAAAERTAAGEISPAALKAKLERGDELVLLDVRDPEELAVVALPGATAIPLAQLPARMHELGDRTEIVAYCLSGARSEKAAKLLRESGFKNVATLSGGIKNWVATIDPTLRRYW